MNGRCYWVYILAGAGHTLYIGVTNDLVRRVGEHKSSAIRGFASRYHLDRLVYYAEFSSPGEAIAVEKKLKGWVRRRKDALIQEFNPEQRDLAAGWFDFTIEGDSSQAQNDVKM